MTHQPLITILLCRTLLKSTDVLISKQVVTLLRADFQLLNGSNLINKNEI